jgi:hypothetical protein
MTPVPTKILGPSLHVETYLADAVTIDDCDLDTEMTRVSADMAWLGAQLATASEAAMRADRAFKRAGAAAGLAAREAGALEGGRRVTEGAIEAAVLLDPVVGAAHEAYVVAEGERLRQLGFFRACSAKKDILQSKAATLRKELEHEPLVRKPAAFDGNPRDYHGDEGDRFDDVPDGS